jgi:prepilin-type N-terminal cleavage/methylation domain-containing protein
MFHPRPQPARRPGFTLIELLVVISIIALLIGILLPALGAARKTARNTACLSNIRSMNQATLNYAADN